MRRLLLVAFLLLAAPAQAQEFSISASPDPVRWPQDQRVTWRVKVKTTDATLARVILDVRSASPDSFGVRGFRLARLLDHEVALEGPGTLSRGSSSHGDPCTAFVSSLPTYGLKLSHAGGSVPMPQEYILDLPGNSESTLVVPAAISTTAPWAGSRHELAVRLPDGAKLVSQVPLQGPTGLPIAFNTEPDSVSPICAKDSPDYASGTEIVVRGHTDPRAAGDFMTIMAGAPGDTEAKAIGRALIASDGTFGFRGHKPTEAGDHAIAVHYGSQRPELADDFAAPLAFRIRPTEGKPEMPPAGFPQMVVRPGTRTSTAIRLRCVSDTQCRGRVRLRRAGRSLSGRHYSIAPNSATIVRLALPARERRLLRGRGRLAVEVQMEIAGGRKHTQRVTLLRR